MFLESFNNLISPLSLCKFLQDYWEHSHLYLSREDSSFYSSLFSLEELHLLLWSVKPDWGKVQLARNREGVPHFNISQTPPYINNISRAFNEGNTVIFNNVHLHSRNIALLTRSVEASLGFVTNANLYLTPPNAQGLSLHYDTHDVFILQVEGKKHWKIYEPWVKLPLDTMAETIPYTYEGEQIQELTLSPGDMLYLPRGMVHMAEATEETSLHLTLGVMVYTWKKFLESVLDIASKKENGLYLRKSLPVAVTWSDGSYEVSEQLESIVQKLVAGLHTNEALKNLTQSLLDIMEPIPEIDHSFRDFTREEVNLQTSVKKSTGTLCKVFEDDNNITLYCTSGSGFSGPKEIKQALLFIAAQDDCFLTRDIPGNLTDKAKIILVKRLLKENILVLRYSL